MSNFISNLIVRTGILLALIMSEKGIEASKLEKFISSWKDELKSLSKIGLKLHVDNNSVKLETLVSFDLYQSVPPEIRAEVEKILWRLIDKPLIVDPVLLSYPIYVPKRILPIADSNYCINCADPPCMKYSKEEFGGVDKFPSRVCPDNLIEFDNEGFLQINEDKCTGCLLCINRCPINAISFSNGIASVKKYTSSKIGKIVEIKNLTLHEKEKTTEDLLNQFGLSEKQFVLPADLKIILDNFDKRISRLGENWDRDQYYVFVRNLLRELGLEVFYSGSGGKLRRADVTIIKPFVVGIEVKSPAESDIDVGAVRQALDAQLEVTKTYKPKEAYCAAVGQEISRGAHNHTLRYSGIVKIPLLRGRYLLYILIKHVTSLPQDQLADVKRLFSDFSGWFGKEELLDYFKKYFDLRISEAKSDKITLPLPKKLKTSGSLKELIVDLQQMNNAIRSEIEYCFPDPERTARGGYAT